MKSNRPQDDEYLRTWMEYYIKEEHMDNPPSRHSDTTINKGSNVWISIKNASRDYMKNKSPQQENVFISSDELDVINTRFGVYQAGSINNNVKTFSSKLLCQGYDTMKKFSLTTGSSSFFIKRGSIDTFGALTGNMLSSVCRQYNSDSMSDGTISRYVFITTSVHKTSNDIPSEILSVQPNIVHVLIVLRISYFHYPIPTAEPISNLKPRVVVGIKESDIEQDGLIISAYNAIRRVIEVEYQKSLQRDAKGQPIYTPLQRAFQRKSSNKLARLAGLCQALSYTIRLCSGCINIVRFGDGLYLKEYIDDEQINWLIKFHDNCWCYYVLSIIIMFVQKTN
ncbi:unnamed protein product [Adineta steineri]|uniref:Uncharacterized protein n=1 Tax=Adineta steineri TaxID=433720 RepID=A0A819WKW7_9BILA|nr:unnamed protein product [Adineta steineri]CAF4126515.1 unnamed protein product [Adineta steineri]